MNLKCRYSAAAWPAAPNPADGVDALADKGADFDLGDLFAALQFEQVEIGGILIDLDTGRFTAHPVGFGKSLAQAIAQRL